MLSELLHATRDLIGAAPPALWVVPVAAGCILVGLRFVARDILRTRRQRRIGGWSALQRQREHFARQWAARQRGNAYGRR